MVIAQKASHLAQSEPIQIVANLSKDSYRMIGELTVRNIPFEYDYVSDMTRVFPILVTKDGEICGFDQIMRHLSEVMHIF